MTGNTFADALIRHGEALLSEPGQPPVSLSSDPEANALLLANPFAFLLAVLYDEGQKADVPWRYPSVLKQRLGHLDPGRMATEGLSHLVDVFNSTTPRLRFPTKFACFTLLAAERVTDHYGGDAAAIWRNRTDGDELMARFSEFYGISQKKASMAVNILVRGLALAVTDRSGIDVSGDRHVVRVFLRGGLIETDSPEEAVAAARVVHPDYPGVLDLPAWDIGRRFCENALPRCLECPVAVACPKLTDRTVRGF